MKRVWEYGEYVCEYLPGDAGGSYLLGAAAKLQRVSLTEADLEETASRIKWSEAFWDETA